VANLLQNSGRQKNISLGLEVLEEAEGEPTKRERLGEEGKEEAANADGVGV
jgi:hypothetical protein